MVLGIKEGLVECATVCVKSVVILTHPDYTLNSTKFEFKANSSGIIDTLGYRVFKLPTSNFQPKFNLG